MITQTAVEYLIDKFDTILPLDFNWDKLEKVFEQAKEMEKEQVINAYKNGQKIAEQYYKEKYNI